MYNVAIIGAGQLGSRHLQAMKTASSSLNIWVMDNHEESLKVAKQRYDEIPMIGEKSIEYVGSIDLLPQQLDLVIVATGSKPRASIVKKLLECSKVKYLVLEKVLFPQISDYEEIENLLKKNQVLTWVNCPRRMFGMYQEIKKYIDHTAPIEMSYEGENWGLCCNAIHMIDLFMFFTGETQYTIDLSGLTDSIEESKREGYVEMTGTINIQTPHGNTLRLTSENGFKGNPGLVIKNQDHCILIDESTGMWSINGENRHYSIPYQSQLTGIVIDEILKTGGCMLTPFELSSLYHQPIMEALLEKYNKLISDNNNKFLPIT